MYLIRCVSLFGIILSLAACFNSSSNTVSKNPVAAPTELSITANTRDIQTNSETISSTNDQLLNIDQLINRGAYTLAEQALNSLPSSDTDPTIKANTIILQAKLQLLAGNPMAALYWLNQWSPSFPLNNSQQHYLYQLRSQAYYRTNNILASVLIDIENHSNYQSIWNTLLMLNASSLETNRTQALPQGWVKLANIAQTHANQFQQLKNDIINWQQNYPHHPANQLLTRLDSATAKHPRSIAVILPLSGSYSHFGQAVQQGILNAYYASPRKTEQTIVFYDTQSMSMDAIYQQAQHHDIILGPLTKDETDSLLKRADEHSPPIISLNYADANTTASHLQFGLSPEDEARQTAKLAWRLGKSSALIISPKTEKAQQIVDAFTNTWSQLGGHTVDSYTYLNTDDFSKSVARWLGASDSAWRQHQLHDALQTRINGNIYFRQDIDMVFLVADAVKARQIRPFIKFYAGNSISVFATSSIYELSANSNDNKDVNDVYFCDMPAILKPDHSQQEDRMYFLGKDVYLLAMQSAHINTLPYFPLHGATGQLTVNPTTHIIERELSCAQFQDGRATALTTS